MSEELNSDIPLEKNADVARIGDFGRLQAEIELAQVDENVQRLKALAARAEELEAVETANAASKPQREKPRENPSTPEDYIIDNAERFNDFLKEHFATSSQRFGDELQQAALKALSFAGSIEAALAEYDNLASGTEMANADLRQQFQKAVEADYDAWKRDAEARVKRFVNKLTLATYEGIYVLADSITGARGEVHLPEDIKPKDEGNWKEFKKKYGGVFMSYPDRFERIVPRGASGIPASVIPKKVGNERTLWEADPPPRKWYASAAPGTGAGTGSERTTGAAGRGSRARGSREQQQEEAEENDGVSEMFTDAPEPPDSGAPIQVKKERTRERGTFKYTFMIPASRVGAKGLYRSDEDATGPLTYSVLAKNLKGAWKEMKDTVRLKSGPDAKVYTTEEQIDMILNANAALKAEVDRLRSPQNRNNAQWNPANVLILLKARVRKDASGWREPRFTPREKELLQSAADDGDEMRGNEFLAVNPDSRAALDAATNRAKDKMTAAERILVLRILGRESSQIIINPLGAERRALAKYNQELNKIRRRRELEAKQAPTRAILEKGKWTKENIDKYFDILYTLEELRSKHRFPERKLTEAEQTHLKWARTTIDLEDVFAKRAKKAAAADDALKKANT